MKRSIAILLCVILCLAPASGAAQISNGDFEEASRHKPVAWTLYGGASYVSETGGASSQNLLPNGDFEAQTDGMFSEWSYYKENRIIQSNAIVKEGGYAAGITNQDGACLSQTLTALADTEYLLSAWVYAEKGAEPELKLNYHTKDDIVCGSSDTVGTVPTENTWHYVTLRIRTPRDAAMVYLYVSTMGTGEAWAYFDDIRFCTAEPEDSFLFETDAVFYYTDMEKGEATVRESGQAKGKKAVFSLSHIGTVLEEKTVYFQNGIAEYTFNLSLLSEIKKEYILRVAVFDKEGKTTEFSERIYKYNRPSALGKDGVYREDDGTPFYPVIGYHVYNDDYLRMPEIGINVIQIASNAVTKAKLDAFEARGLKALICLYPNMRPGGHPDEIKNTIKTVKAFRDHPAVFGYASMDEPFWNTRMDSMEVWVRDTYKIVRDLDDVHPVYICQAPAHYYAVAEQYCDILACDPYSYNDDTAKTTVQTEMAKRAARGNKPVYTVVQTYTSSPNWFPSGDVIRAQIRRALASGAKGVGCYSVSDAAYDGTPIYNVDSTWEALQQFAKEELSLLFALYSDTAYKILSDSGNADALHDVYYKSWRKTDENKIYIDVHNRSKKSTKNIRIPFSQIGNFVVRKAGESEEHEGNGAFSVTLAPGASGVYILTPDTTLPTWSGEPVYPTKYTEEKFLPIGVRSKGSISEGSQYVALPFKGAGIMQRLSGLLPYHTYRLSFSYKSSVQNAALLRLDFGVNGGNGYLPWDIYCEENEIEFLKQEKSYTEKFGTETDGEAVWQTMTVDFYMPRYADAVSVYIEADTVDLQLAVDSVTLCEENDVNLLKNGGLDYLKDEKTLFGGWIAYDTYMKNYGNAVLKDGYIEMREHSQDTSANLRQHVYLYAGETYELTFDFLGDEPEIGIWYADKRANTISSWGEKASSWNRYTVYFTAEETNRYTLWFGGKNTKGIYCYDNIRLIPYTRKNTELLKIAGSAINGGSVTDVALPYEKASELYGDVYAVANNPENKHMLIVCGYKGEKELVYFDMAKTDRLLIPAEEQDASFCAFLWADSMRPV